MEDHILKLIRALRASGVPVSLAESSEAFLAVEALGINNKSEFRLSLRATLIKNVRDLKIFDKLFPLYFDPNIQFDFAGNIADNLGPDDGKLFSEALTELIEKLRQSFSRLQNGEFFTKAELEMAAKLAGLDNISDLDYQSWAAHKMELTLSIPEMQAAIKQLIGLLQKMNFNPDRLNLLRDLMKNRLQDFQMQIMGFAGDLIASNLSQQAPRGMADGLLNRAFESLSENEKRILASEVKRLVLSIRTKIALRQKRAKTGHLDAKTTLRRSLRYHGVPMIVYHRDRAKKPKLIVFCDVSTSMRFCSELMLSFINSLQAQVQKCHAFAFIDHLEYISDEFIGKDGNLAIASILKQMPAGSYNTDLGHSLDTFSKNYLDMLDGHTTLIIVGDGRNNYHDPRLDIFSSLVRRANRTLWLSPEPEYLWGTGDSDMPGYAPFCTAVLKVSNVTELVEAIDKFMVN